MSLSVRPPCPSRFAPIAKGLSREISYQSNRLPFRLGVLCRLARSMQRLRKEMPMRTMIIISSLLLALTTSVASAASYCAVFAWGKSCGYVNLDECLRAAGSQGGCEINPKEDKAPSGTAPFCLVTPYSTKCIYDDAATCRMAASIERSRFIQNGEPGVCEVNPNR